MAKNRKNITGLKFGLLSVLRDTPATRRLPSEKGKRNRYVLCQCDCGQKTSVRVDHLRRGKIRSCGCLASDIRWAQQMRALFIADPDAAAAYQREHEAALARSTALGGSCVSAAQLAALDTSPTRTAAERRYDMSPGDYQALLTEQAGVCAICREPPTIQVLHVDHDHETGRVRGLLCRPCNHGLGFFRDDLNRLAGAMRYLTTGKAVK